MLIVRAREEACYVKTSIRFNIAYVIWTVECGFPAESIESVASSDAEKLSKNTAREDWKRYRKEFQQPVKFR